MWIASCALGERLARNPEGVDRFASFGMNPTERHRAGTGGNRRAVAVDHECTACTMSPLWLMTLVNVPKKLEDRSSATGSCGSG